MKKILILVAIATMLASCANPSSDDNSSISEAKTSTETVKTKETPKVEEVKETPKVEEPKVTPKVEETPKPEVKETVPEVEDFTGYVRATAMTDEYIRSLDSTYLPEKGINYVFYPKGFDYKTKDTKLDKTYIKLKYVKTIKYEFTETDTANGFAYGVMYEEELINNGLDANYIAKPEIDVYEVYVKQDAPTNKVFLINRNTSMKFQWKYTDNKISHDLYRFRVRYNEDTSKWVMCVTQYYSKAYPELAQ